MQRLGLVGVAVGLATALAGSEASAQRPMQDAISPLSQYRSADARALHEAHRTELEGLYSDVRRCAPEVDFNKPGIGFRRPQDVPGASPYLALWVWVDTPEQGGDPAARATEAFRLHARTLVARLVGRAPVLADARVGGYILVLTWVGPTQTEGRSVVETLVVRAAKPAAATFVAGSLPVSDSCAVSRSVSSTVRRSSHHPAALFRDRRSSFPQPPASSPLPGPRPLELLGQEGDPAVLGAALVGLVPCTAAVARPSRTPSSGPR